jgi:Dullard-like phosphatase family protein
MITKNNIDQSERSPGMPNLLLPEIRVIQNSEDQSGQVLLKLAKTSWLASLCNCFKGSSDRYSNVQDFSMIGLQLPEHQGKNTLVLDLDETLVHSSFIKISNPDIKLDIAIEGQHYSVYVLKRPYVDLFLKKCCEMFEVIIFTASLSSYANPLIDLLDPEKLIKYRLFREKCSFINNSYVKDLSKLGRDLKKVVIVDVSYN